jgi:oligoribonuclease (3'-5' exoribonuclease)
MIPFLVDGFVSLMAVYTAFIMDFSENLKQELLGNSVHEEERKFLPILFSRLEKYIYNKTDDKFMPELCNESFKNNAFM